MEYQTLQMEVLPPLRSPALIVGLRGWGDALEVSSGAAAFIVDSFAGQGVGRLDPDRCYRYDASRPVVKIESGRLHRVDPPEGRFFAITTPTGERDLLILIADEPGLSWYRFSTELVDLAQQIDASSVITLGSMMDSVLHTDRTVSAVTTGEDYAGIFQRHGVLPINYRGPSAIHSVILDACRKRAVTGASLWSHCPAYLQGIRHHGMMQRLVHLLTEMASFTLKTDILAARWEALEVQIRQLIADNPKIEGIIDQIRKQKRAGAIQNLGKSGGEDGNVINLQDFRDQ